MVIFLAIAMTALASPSWGQAGAARPKTFTLPYSGETRFFWRYPKAEGEALTVNQDNGRRRDVPEWEELALICQADGSLRVEARGLMLSSDVPLMINPADFTRLAVKSETLRLDTTMTPRGNGFETWSHGVFKNGARSVPQLLAGRSLVVTAINRKPRSKNDEDMAIPYPAPDWDRTATFRAGCAKAASGVKPR
jgi:hypothetical protein